MGVRRARRGAAPFPSGAPTLRQVRVEVRGLTKSFGTVQAVTDLSFTVEPGSVTGFLGPNGAGKTTTLRMLLGLLHPDAGTATFDGTPYAGLPDPVRTVGAVLETAFHPARSGRNHLRVYCRAAGLPRLPGRRGPRPGGPRRRRGPPRRRLLPRHAAAAGPGRRPARGPRRPRAGRAGQRPGPRGDPVAARIHPVPRARGGPHRPGLQPPALGGRADRRPGGHRGRRATGPRGHHRAAPLRRRRRRHGARAQPRGRPSRRRAARRRHRRWRPEDGGALSVTGSTPADVGRQAFAAGIELHELRSRTSGLEEIYFQLTAGQEQFAAPSPGTTTVEETAR